MSPRREDSFEVSHDPAADAPCVDPIAKAAEQARERTPDREPAHGASRPPSAPEPPRIFRTRRVHVIARIQARPR
jgi:hypothetical protein